MILVSGPTGSGKTTTLAAALSSLNDSDRKIVTIEDPVEYQIPGIVQTQVSPAIGVSFSTAIRAFVRQDPDIIMVGEVRDGETARAAFQAALTGHLLLSTVHANSAAAALTRLRDLGIESYLLAGALRGVIAQRLVRRLCPVCKAPASTDQALAGAHPAFAARVRKEGGQFHEARGCSQCGGTGYRGRAGVFELLPVTGSIFSLVEQGASMKVLEKAAQEEGMTTMFDDALAKARAGVTSLKEVFRVTGFE
jgi:general secretion pathway protein E